MNLSEAPDSLVASLEEKRPQLIRYASKILGPHAAFSEDVVQEAILHAIKYESTNPYQDVKQKAIDFLRHEHSQRAGGGKVKQDIGLIDIATYPKEEPDSTELVQQALQELPERYANLLRTVYMDDTSYQETAEQEGICLGTVKSRLHIARSKLRQVLRFPN